MDGGGMKKWNGMEGRKEEWNGRKEERNKQWNEGMEWNEGNGWKMDDLNHLKSPNDVIGKS